MILQIPPGWRRMTPWQIQVHLRMMFLSSHSGGSLSRIGSSKVAWCATVSISRWRMKYQLCWDLLHWTTLWIPPDWMQMTPQQIKVHQKLMLLPSRSGGALGRGLLQVAQCAIGMRRCKMSMEAFPIDTKECMSMLPSHCAKSSNSVHTNVVHKQARLRVVIRRSRWCVFIKDTGREKQISLFCFA